MGTHTFPETDTRNVDAATIDELIMGRMNPGYDDRRDNMPSEQTRVYWYEAWHTSTCGVSNQIHRLPSNQLDAIPANAQSVIVSGSDPLDVKVYFNSHPLAYAAPSRLLVTLQCVDGDLVEDIVARAEKHLGYTPGALQLHASNKNPYRVFKCHSSTRSSCVVMSPSNN